MRNRNRGLFHIVWAREGKIATRRRFPRSNSRSSRRQWRILVHRIGDAPDKQIDLLRIGDIKIRRLVIAARPSALFVSSSIKARSTMLCKKRFRLSGTGSLGHKLCCGVPHESIGVDQIYFAQLTRGSRSG
jgi:hypothetical protein